MTTQQQYIANWHDSFVNYISSMLTFVESLLLPPQATDEDKRVIDMVKALLKEILKKLSYYQIEQYKQAELMRLEALQIPVL